jgi:hypothetical protein
MECLSQRASELAATRGPGRVYLRGITDCWEKSMTALTIMDDDAATLWYHPEAGIVHHRFKRPAHGEEFRRVLECGLALFVEHGAAKWLSDDRSNYALTLEDTRWTRGDWEPRVVAAGWAYWAVVLPRSTVATVDMQSHMDSVARFGVDVQVFSDPLLAQVWLESV